MDQQKTGYSKYLSRLDVWAISLSCIIGWGAFVMPGTTFLPVAGPVGTAIAMIIGALIMGIQMPVMDGYEATKAIRALDNRALANIPVVAMTANAFKEDEEDAESAGMQAHLAKPLDIEKMLKTLSWVLSATDP